MTRTPEPEPTEPLRPNGAFPRLTNRQMAIVRDLAQGWDIATIAQRRDRSLSSVYEIAGRICDRLGLDEWTQIGPYARDHGLVGLNDQKSPGHPAES